MKIRFAVCLFAIALLLIRNPAKALGHNYDPDTGMFYTDYAL